jgi:transcription initiation factor TFIIB
MQVVNALDDDVILGVRAIRTWRLANHLPKLADQVPVRPEMSRCTVAASALCAADRSLSRNHLTQEQVAVATIAI